MSDRSDYLEQLGDRFPEKTEEELLKILEEEGERGDAAYEAQKEE